MTMTLLDAAQPEDAEPEDAPGETQEAARPENRDADPPVMPEYLAPKFWDEVAGEVKVEDLARSYADLERRFGSAEGNTVPGDPADYRLENLTDGLQSDPEVNQRLMEAGFTQQQAQIVYDLAGEKLLPLIRDLAQETVRNDAIRRLSQHFGGDEKWQALSAQMKTWARANLPDAVFSALGGSYDGVLTLHRMMSDGEPGLLSGALPAPRGRTEADLKKMMDDPRYWRDHDPAFIAEVQRGFEDLYPDAG